MKYYQTKKDKELFYYFNVNGDTLYRYRHRYYDSLGKRREKSKQGFTREIVAYRELLTVRTSTSEGITKHIEDEGLTVTDWLNLWYETKKNGWEISTRDDRKRLIRKVINPLIGSYKLSRLDSMTYEREFINELLKNFAPSTTQLYHNIFKIAINAAVSNGTLKENKYTGVTVADKDEKEINFLSDKELNKLISAGKTSSATDYAMLILLAYTGLRKGEVNALTWEDINYEEKTLNVNKTRDHKGTRRPKTKNSFRKIRINDDLIQQLEVYNKWCKQLKLFYGEYLLDDEYIFLSSRGAVPVHPSKINQGLDSMIKKAGIKRITPHGLRHTHASSLLNRGLSVATVAKRLGNTAEEINRTYGHSDKAADDRAVEVLDSVINI